MEKRIYFNSSGGCTKGSRCKFSHTLETAICNKRVNSCFYKYYVVQSGLGMGSVETLNYIEHEL